jgi:5'-deoxynucleotidase YfbR-like HD superfamily hydrolase
MGSFPELDGFLEECREMDNETLTEEMKNYMRELIPLKRKVVRADVSPRTYYANRDSYRVYKLQVEVIKKVINERIAENPDHPKLKNFWKEYAEWLEEMV